MDLGTPDYAFARFAIERGIAAIYLVAFVVAVRQFPALSGEHGLEPASRVLAVTTFWELPSLFHWRYSDRLLVATGGIGIVLSAALLLGLPQQAPLPVTMATWFVLWGAYSSIVNVGGTFYAFGWETLLLEAGFLAIFLGNDDVAPPWPVILAFRWLAFRVEFGAGLIKLRGDRCWRELTCMDFHHETQPLPNPLSWVFHHLPRPLHRVEAVGNFVAQLVVPWGLFLPQPVASAAAALIVVTQLYLVVSGNYAWLNWLTIVVALAAIPDPAAPLSLRSGLGLTDAAFGTGPPWFAVAVVLLTALIVVLSYFPVRNLLSSRQAMNASFDPFRIVNTYGAFGTVGRERYEVIVEGTLAEDPGRDAEWLEYGFRAKPGDPKRLPPQVAPYHLRLDWLMWFLPLSPAYAGDWFGRFLLRLLQGDPPTLRLLRHDPFAGQPPRWVRARLMRYRFTSWRTLRATGAWWERADAGEFVAPVRLPPSG